LNLTAFVPGRMGRLQEVQCERENPSGILVVQADHARFIKLELAQPPLEAAGTGASSTRPSASDRWSDLCSVAISTDVSGPSIRVGALHKPLIPERRPKRQLRFFAHSSLAPSALAIAVPCCCRPSPSSARAASRAHRPRFKAHPRRSRLRPRPARSRATRAWGRPTRACPSSCPSPSR